MNNILEYTVCSNCGCCYNVCPKDAITVKSGEFFYELAVDETKCVSCGICKNVCPVNAPKKVQTIRSAYALIHNDELIVRNSSSGGAFSALAEWIMDQDGVVFGAAYTADCTGVEMASTKTVKLDHMRRSKYVESQVGYTFREVKEWLDEGKYVLYCGAPCQIAGLVRFLRKDYERLLTCDFSCGGLPSHKINQQNLGFIAKKLCSNVGNVNFRPKTYGWSTYAIKCRGENGKSYNCIAVADPYFDCFIGNHFSVRDNCLTCTFAENHYADITLADYWKYKTDSMVANGNKGISLVLTNSSKGEQFIEAIRKRVALTVLDTTKASYNLKNKAYSEAFLKKREGFLQQCKEDGFAAVAKRMPLRSATKLQVKYFIKSMIGKE